MKEYDTNSKPKTRLTNHVGGNKFGHRSLWRRNANARVASVAENVKQPLASTDSDHVGRFLPMSDSLDSSLKVLITIENLAVGGVKTNFDTIIEHLAGLGATLYIIGPQFTGGKRPILTTYKDQFYHETRKYRVHVSDFDFDFAIPDNQIYTSILYFQPDVVITFGDGLLAYWAGKICKKAHVPCIANYNTNLLAYTDHYTRSRLSRGIVIRLTRMKHKNDTLTVVPSMSMMQELIQYGLDESKMVVINHSVSKQFFNTPCDFDLRQKLIVDAGGSKDARIVLTVSRFAPEKNLSGLKTLNDLFPHIVHIMIGDGPLRSQLEQELHRSYFIGEIDHTQIHHYFAAADIFAFTSTSETYGLVIAEAQASGCVVVAINGNGVKDQVTPDSGYICDSTEEMQKTIAFLVSNPDILAMKSIAAREHATQYASRDREILTLSTTIRKAIR